jgi:hypothetical protein
MSATQPNSDETNGTRRIIYLIIGVVALLLIVGLFYLKSRPDAGARPGQAPRLEGALRAGTPEFEKYRAQIILDKPEATWAKRPIGDIVMTLRTTVRNFTGRTINGLEIYAAVVDSQKQPVKERVVIVVPTRQAELEQNQTMEVPVLLEGMREADDRADIKMEVAGIRFK